VAEDDSQDKSVIAVPERLPTDRVIRSDIRYAIALGVRSLNSFFDRDRENKPFFGATCRPDGKGWLEYGSVGFRVSHITGRCLWSTMLAEEVAGIPYPEDGLRILEPFHKQVFDNTDSINSYLDPGQDNKRFIQVHNLREGLLGLVALIKGRNRAWARDRADRMIARMTQFTSPDGAISMELAKKVGIGDRLVGVGPNAVTNGRAVGALVEYYKATGSKAALKLADLWARGTLKRSFAESGEFKPQPNPESTGHIHSLTSSLSGIAMYAAETKDAEMLDWCARILDVGVPPYSSSWGWMVEGMHGDRFKGEMNQTGDVIRTALTLARAGQRKYFELAERWCRNMLLHAQHREEELMQYMVEIPNPPSDRERDVLSRNIGGYGIKLPNARMQKGHWCLSTLDITSGVVHALCECWRSRAEVNENAVRIDLLFDYNDDDIELKSSLPLVGKLRFFKKSDKDLYVRVPEWVDTKTLRVEIQGTTVKNPAIRDGYLHVTSKKGSIGTVWFDVPRRVEREKLEDGVYTVTWWGNQVIDIVPRGEVSPIPF
jgi:hypothetical protein